MGEYADDFVDRWIDSSWGRRSARRPANWQSGTGHFSWKDDQGNVLDMRAMTDEHLRNAIAVCNERGNPGKAADLRVVLQQRCRDEFGVVALDDSDA